MEGEGKGNEEREIESQHPCPRRSSVGSQGIHLGYELDLLSSLRSSADDIRQALFHPKGDWKRFCNPEQSCRMVKLSCPALFCLCHILTIEKLLLLLLFLTGSQRLQ